MTNVTNKTNTEATKGFEMKANCFKAFVVALEKSGISLKDIKGMRARRINGGMWYMRFTIKPHMFWEIRPVLEQANIEYRLFDTDCLENVDFGSHPLEGTV